MVHLLKKSNIIHTKATPALMEDIVQIRSKYPKSTFLCSSPETKK
jgi:hypothetical protein